MLLRKREVSCLPSIESQRAESRTEVLMRSLPDESNLIAESDYMIPDQDCVAEKRDILDCRSAAFPLEEM